ncbi:MAG: flagellar basal body rod protein FlgB [Candidatus Hydrogenedentes bacterium]|nr:flagellar basal body rod protein FlgB [Candidatus Hydrogenedentota bacterium]
MLYAGVDTSRLLVDGMRTAEFNQRIIANNVANADTPNYTPASVDFQSTLRAALEGHGHVALRTTRAVHFEASRHLPEFEGVAILSKNDYNKVDLDYEVAKLSENTGRYVVFGSLLAKKFRMIKDMLTGLR